MASKVLKPSEVLRKALEWFGPNGERWERGHSGEPQRRCALNGICEVERRGYAAPVGFLRAAVYGHREADGSVVDWNDHTAKDFSEIRAGFEKAIELAKAEGQ